VLITTEAPLGEIAQLGPERVALAQRLIAIRGKNGVVNNTFLKFLMQSAAVQDQLRARATGTTVLGIKQSELRKVLLTLPPIEEQRAIAHILGTLDDKIALNRRMNETLEGIARAIFKSWFVDFDPVRAKAEGRGLGLPKKMADLFPDHFEDSELGEIPAGWRIETIGEIAENPRRGVVPSEVGSATPYVGLEHIPRRSIALANWGYAHDLESNKFEFRRSEILFGKLRPYFHKVVVAPVDGVCSTDILVVQPRKPQWFGFLLGHISSVAFIDYTDASSTGTKMPRTNWRDMGLYEVVLPPDQLAAVFTELIRSSIERILANVHESHTLATLRDTLLPKLISGELRIPAPKSIIGRPT